MATQWNVEDTDAVQDSLQPTRVNGSEGVGPPRMASDELALHVGRMVGELIEEEGRRLPQTERDTEVSKEFGWSSPKADVWSDAEKDTGRPRYGSARGKVDFAQSTAKQSTLSASLRAPTFVMPTLQCNCSES